jgi:hypothetical protein
VRTLLEECDRPEEVLLSEGSAQMHWDGSAFRAALREIPEYVRAHRPVDVLNPAALGRRWHSPPLCPCLVRQTGRASTEAGDSYTPAVAR